MEITILIDRLSGPSGQCRVDTDLGRHDIVLKHGNRHDQQQRTFFESGSSLVGGHVPGAPWASFSEE